MRNWKYINGAEGVKVGNASKSEIIEKKKKEGATLKVDNGQKLEFSDGSTYVKTSFSDDYREAHNYVGNAKFKIMQDLGIMGVFKIYDGWEADSEEEAVKEFIKLNPAYANGKKGYIKAEKTGNSNVEAQELEKDVDKKDKEKDKEVEELKKAGNFKTGKSNLKPGDKIISFGKSGTVKGVYDEDADTIYGEPLIEVEFEDGTTKKIGEHYMRKVGNAYKPNPEVIKVLEDLSWKRISQEEARKKLEELTGSKNIADLMVRAPLNFIPAGNCRTENGLKRAFNAMAKNDVIAIKEAWGWTIKDYTGEVPTGKTFKIFKTRNDADKWIEEQ